MRIVCLSLSSILLMCSGTCADDVLVAKHRVGDIYVGVHKHDVFESYKGSVSETVIVREGEDQPALKVQLLEDHYIMLELDDLDRVWAIRIEDPFFLTDRGVGVGDSLARIHEEYQEAKLHRGAEDGGYISLYVDDLGGFFSFDISNVSDQLLTKNSIDKDAIATLKAEVIVLLGI